MKTFVMAAAIGAGVLTAGIAQAQQAPAPDATASDMQRRPPPRPRPSPLDMLQRADADGDGVITREEALAEADRRFAELDTDHDGRLTRDEQRADRPGGFPPPPPPPASDDGSAPPPATDGAGPPPPPPGSRDPDRRDDRGRGPGRPVTQKQFRERAAAIFDRVDINRDGRIDAQEIAAARLLERARRARRSDRDNAPPPDGAR